MTAPELSPYETDAGWLQLAQTTSYEHYRPLSEAATAFITEAQDDRRAYLGIPQFDQEMRGISPGHLAMLVGYSHSGKTLVTLHVVRKNANRRVVWFIPDEPRTLVLTKLASLVYGMPARRLEQLVCEGDAAAVRLIHETAEQFPNLAVFDRPLTPRFMNAAFAEIADRWGENADLVIVDYMDLVQIGDSVNSKADFLKAFGTEHEVPMLVLHQTSRTAGANGRPMRIDSGNYGGEVWATYQLGVWRKRSALVYELNELRARTYIGEQTLDRISQIEADMRVHEHTLTLNLNKNKRPGGGLIESGIDFELFHDTGQIVPLNGNLPVQCRALRLVEEHQW